MLYPAELRARMGKHLILTKSRFLHLPEHFRRRRVVADADHLQPSRRLSEFQAAIAGKFRPTNHEARPVLPVRSQGASRKTPVVLLEQYLRVGICNLSASFVGR